MYADQGQDCEEMMAHYFHFLSLVNQCIFYCIACLFAKLTKIESGMVLVDYKQPNLIGNFGTFILPVLVWLCTKYNFHYSLNIFIQSILTMLSTIAYFYKQVMSSDTYIHIGNGNVIVLTKSVM